jgi:hypothetical protein
VPLGGWVVDSGGAFGRSCGVESSSDGAPARTARGPVERGAAVASAATARGFAAGFGFARGLAAARGFAAGFGFAAPRSRPKRVGRVSGRLPRTLWSSVVLVIDQPVYVSLRALGAFAPVDWVKPVACSGVEGSWMSSPMEDFGFSA